MKNGAKRTASVPEKAKPPWINGRDIDLVAWMVALAPLATVLGPATWPRLCAGIGQIRGRLQGRRFTAKARRIEHIFGDALPRPATDIAMAHIAAHYTLHCHVLRMSIVRKWRPAVTVNGQEHLRQALAKGCGAVLWIGNFSCASVVQKQSMAEAGYRVSHLSRSSHAFSTTVFGRCFINPIQVGVEERFVAERILLGDRSATAAMRKMRARLAENGLVSISEGGDGARNVAARLFDGKIRLATGAPRLAYSSGAPLLPVFTVSTGPSVFTVDVGSPLAEGARAEAGDYVATAVGDYAARLEDYLRRVPEQWDGWYSVADVS